ncbi:MAG: divalent metal cation transporter [Rubrivivax sp.]|nr:divalent metal cation transporter [Rubrivivax sp.]
MPAGPASAPSPATDKKRRPGLLGRLGPGLITGAADDDPSGIATYSQAGAQFRFGLAWTLLLTTPLMIAVQLVSARIGYVTRQGLAAGMCRLLPRRAALVIVAALVVANTINIAADISAMAEATRLLTGGPSWPWVLAWGGASAALQIYASYERTVRVLKWLTLTLFAYVAVVLVIEVPWRRALEESAAPWRALPPGSAKAYAAMVVAMLGTTISPYLFFWQATQEAEEHRRAAKAPTPHPGGPAAERHGGHDKTDKRGGHDKHDKDDKQDPQDRHGKMAGRLAAIRQDTVLGMLLSNAVALCIVFSAAVALNLAGHTDIRSAADAAAALQPVAGEFAFALFALGIVGTGALAIPVLAGSAAYAVSEVFGWRAGLSRRFQDARGFYSIILAATLLGTAMSLVQVDAMAALVTSAVINGVIAVPVMAVMLLIGRSRRLLGEFVIGPWLAALGWAATAVMAAASLAMFATMFG